MKNLKERIYLSNNARYSIINTLATKCVLLHTHTHIAMWLRCSVHYHVSLCTVSVLGILGMSLLAQSQNIGTVKKQLKACERNLFLMEAVQKPVTCVSVCINEELQYQLHQAKQKNLVIFGYISFIFCYRLSDIDCHPLQKLDKGYHYSQFNCLKVALPAKP